MERRENWELKIREKRKRKVHSSFRKTTSSQVAVSNDCLISIGRDSYSTYTGQTMSPHWAHRSYSSILKEPKQNNAPFLQTSTHPHSHHILLCCFLLHRYPCPCMCLYHNRYPFLRLFDFSLTFRVVLLILLPYYLWIYISIVKLNQIFNSYLLHTLRCIHHVVI